MKHVLLLITTTLAMAFFAIAPAHAQQSRTLKSEMEVIHESLGVNFVYDSAIEINVPYLGKPMKDVVKGNRKEHSVLLEECLQTLFAGTGIEYEVMKKYIVLTQADKRKKPKDYTIFIEEQKDSIPEAVITALIDPKRNETQTGLTRINGKSLNKGFALLSSPDLIKSIQMLPGVSGGTELLSGLYVHGGDGSDNLFLLDGVPLYQVTHLGGLISSFNTEMINNLDFYKSGFPSRFGGKLSSVSDITTRQGDMHSYHGSFNIGLLNGGIQFEGPIVPGKSSFNVGMRRSWFDVLTIPAIAIVNSRLPYGQTKRMRYAMTDFNINLTHLFSEDSRLALNVYTGSDLFRYGNETQSVKYWEGIRNTGENGHDLNVRWGNILTSLNWKKEFSDQLLLNTILYYTRASNNIMLDNYQWSVAQREPLITDYITTEKNRSRLHDLSAKADIDWIPSEYHHIRTGIIYTQHLFRPYKDIYSYSEQTEILTDGTYSLVSAQVHENESFTTSYDASEVNIYVEDEIALSNRFKTSLGLRYTAFATDGKIYNSLEPRAALRFQCGPNVSLKMSYTEMSQFIHKLQANYIDIPMSSWLPVSDEVPPMRSRQVAGGIYANLPLNITLNVEGYWKTMDNLYEYCGIGILYPDVAFWEEELMKGKGRSYGAEVHLSWRSERTEVAAYYTLSWTERFFESIWQDWYPARNDNRHRLTINVTHRFNDRFEMYGAWNYHTGDRMTIPTQLVDGEPFYSSPYNYRLPDYHRMDIGFNLHKTTKRGNESIWNLSLYNAYCRMNPMFAVVDSYVEDDVRHNKLTTMALIPIIPSFSYTLKF